MTGKQSILADHQQGRQVGLAQQCTLTTQWPPIRGKLAPVFWGGAPSQPLPSAQPFSFLPAGPPSPCCSQESKVNWDELSAAGGDIWPVSTPCEEVETYLYCRHISRATRPPRAPPSR